MWLIGKGHCELHQVQVLASMLSGSAVAYPLATGYATHRGLPALHGAGSKALRILRKEADADRVWPSLPHSLLGWTDPITSQ
jgi:hypothetical protein